MPESTAKPNPVPRAVLPVVLTCCIKTLLRAAAVPPVANPITPEVAPAFKALFTST